MRYAVLIPDGAADRPDPRFGGGTAFDKADCPHFDRLAREGWFGLAKTVPDGLPPGSDVANLSALGYDPADCYTGRAPLEAAAQGLTLAEDEIVFRANTVTLRGGVLVDNAAGHPPSDEAAALIQDLDREMALPGVRLHPGVSYRHLCVFNRMRGAVPERIPPHDILEQPAADHPPTGPNAERLLAVEERTRAILAEHPYNQKRRAAGANEISQLWIWGGGPMPTLEPFARRFGVEGSLISAVDLLNGIARLTGLQVRTVPGATGYYDTDYAAKGAAALAALAEQPFVAIHVEAPDEAGHNADAEEKVRAIENIDRKILAPLLAEADRAGDLRLLVLPDHPTPIRMRTHTPTPVPAALWGPGFGGTGATAFTEAAAGTTARGRAVFAPDLMRHLVGLTEGPPSA